MIRGSRSVPIVTPPQSRKVLQVQAIDRSTGWGQGSVRFHILTTDRDRIPACASTMAPTLITSARGFLAQHEQSHQRCTRSEPQHGGSLWAASRVCSNLICGTDRLVFL